MRNSSHELEGTQHVAGIESLHCESAVGDAAESAADCVRRGKDGFTERTQVEWEGCNW